MTCYFAYGSNLHPLRLSERVPSATLIGTARIHDHKLIFHKIGRDGSAKCSYITKKEAVLYGAVYAIAHEDKAILDRIEGVGSGYIQKQMIVHCNADEFECFTYQAQAGYIDNSLKPYHWYKQLVLLGARHLDFPENHVFSIESHPSITDPDESRRYENGLLIRNISGFTF